VKLPSPHPLYGYPEPVAPSRAARAAADTIDLARIAAWARTATTLDAVPPTPNRAPALVVETAGGVFSPLSATATNLDLARELEPATWLLVAPDRLGVLHDVTSCLEAMATLGRRPDWLILSAPADPDPSTGSNAQELALVPGCPPIIELPRNDATPLLRLLSPLAHPKNA
jgi:dethiobiotin synthetase